MDLTHVDEAGAARMVDVTGKDATARTAVAAGVFRTTAEVIEKIAANAVAKGDVLATARIAGIMGVKRTPDLVPLCHPLPVTGVQVDLQPGGAEIAITATVKCTGRTGVEMEALTAVAVAGLTLHDMVKAIDPAAVLTDIRVLTKEGGKTGSWSRDD
ncbi:Cyclic pyranopterin monophosphate synthase OS=Tsukamurella paurometabola (strain ATCC 8368 / DSM/ CCUG 35730 / CIP 100753 / JCM 10117 / KCTC 9821 / NBRC 16120 / NCIMB 702349 / NCTC 13040) OX=521096 GN=moaC PE=3 SV=1 [Tsukamurella paurometabola]|uniref:Cyclic pyranopterin monophosphate synthase n=1 Tax=Tsukamurella paurometabola (strain ATCC 8368 / DSM 20162 / CCUG 35730 / CIP 100753 / JCM 10117 / KCTC 9821 / NBRC 16120 / NCIMB 702349 / NCTC 13040) TaxID=521096 RepID=D5UTU9_TSUPD|nr:cyclic pyranopterin monophosphate synthase MoaC [Tsukamurella paurometabola]ADG77453.1 molybdenum cofactor biosynthesis protein C [Tsukamurella paurometabola DSM 20162]SUP27110.1 Molybdenum cofactor biosynthesis protein C [Tsukamurella paurometabola]